MLQSDLLFLLGGLAAGILLASFASIFYHRAKGRTASGLLNAARAEAARLQVDARHEAERLVTDSAREIETVRAGAEVEGKMASLKLREEVEKEAVKRREELDRLEKRALDREQSLDRRSQDIKEQESRVAVGVGPPVGDADAEERHDLHAGPLDVELRHGGHAVHLRIPRGRHVHGRADAELRRQHGVRGEEHIRRSALNRVLGGAGFHSS